MNGTSILILDGERDLCQATALLLAKRGGQVSTAATVDEALDHAAARIYDVAIIDTTSRSPRATDVVRRMRERGCAPRRFVVCCDEPFVGDEEQFAAVLQKPYAFDRLVRAVFGEGGRRRPTHSGVFPRLRGALRTPKRAAQGRRGRG